MTPISANLRNVVAPELYKISGQRASPTTRTFVNALGCIHIAGPVFADVVSVGSLVVYKDVNGGSTRPTGHAGFIGIEHYFYLIPVIVHNGPLIYVRRNLVHPDVISDVRIIRPLRMRAVVSGSGVCAIFDLHTGRAIPGWYIITSVIGVQDCYQEVSSSFEYSVEFVECVITPTISIYSGGSNSSLDSD